VPFGVYTVVSFSSYHFITIKRQHILMRYSPFNRSLTSVYQVLYSNDLASILILSCELSGNSADLRKFQNK